MTNLKKEKKHHNNVETFKYSFFAALLQNLFDVHMKIISPHYYKSYKNGCR